MGSARAEGVSATIHTRYSEQFLTDLKKHNEQYPSFAGLHHSANAVMRNLLYFLRNPALKN